MNPNTPQTPAPCIHGATPKPYNGPVTVTPAQPHGATPKPYNGRVTVTPAQLDKLIRIKTVCELTGLGKTSVYSISDFPKRVVLSRRAVGWRLSEVQAWIQSRTSL